MDGSLRGTVTHDSFNAVLDHVRQSSWPADLVALTGDLIQDDTREAYRHFPAMMTPLGLPILCVPGNHDVRQFMHSELASEPFRYCAALSFGNWQIVGIDSCIEGSAAGRVEADELERLESCVSSASAAHVLVCIHHPPLPVGSRWLDSVGMENGQEFLDLIARIPTVRGVLFGHVHQPFDEIRGSLRIVGTPSTCRQFAVGSDDFALDDNPPSYRRVELLPDGNISSELVWLSGGGQP